MDENPSEKSEMHSFLHNFSSQSNIIIISQVTRLRIINYFLASGNFCHLLITFANSLDPDQDQLNVLLDLDPNCLQL